MSLRFLVLAQLRAVRDAGGTAIGISAPGPWVAALEAEGIRAHRAGLVDPVDGSARRPAARRRELWRILRRERIDVLHTHNPKPGLYGRIVGRLARVPIVVNTVHGLYATDDDPIAKRALVYGLEAIAARCSDAELFQNPEDLALMRRLHLDAPRAAPRQRHRPHPLRSATASAPSTRRAVRAELGVHDTRRRRRLRRSPRGREGLPGAVRRVRAASPRRYRLVVVGGTDDPDKPDALDRGDRRRRPATGASSSSATATTSTASTRRWTSSCSPSHREGFPRAAMEAPPWGSRWSPPTSGAVARSSSPESPARSSRCGDPRRSVGT